MTPKPVEPLATPITRAVVASRPVRRILYTDGGPCKNIYFLILGLLTGLLLGLLMSHSLEFDRLSSNKCIVPCDRLLNEFESHLSISMDKESEMEQAALNPAGAMTKLENAILTKASPVPKVEIPSDIVPIPAQPMDVHQIQEEAPSAPHFIEFRRFFVAKVGLENPDSPVKDETPKDKDAELEIVALDQNQEKPVAEILAKDSDNNNGFPISIANRRIEYEIPIPSNGDVNFEAVMPGLISRMLQFAIANAKTVVESSEVAESDENDKSAGSVSGEDKDMKVIKYDLGPAAPLEPVKSTDEVAKPVEPVKSKDEVAKPVELLEPVKGQDEVAKPIEPVKGHDEVAKPDDLPEPVKSKQEVVQAVEPKAPVADHSKDTYEFYISYPDDKATWFEAFDRCASRDMELVSLQYAEKTLAVEQTLTLIAGSDHGQTFWTSGTNLLSEYDFDYNWASTGEPITYTKWVPNEDSRLSKDENHCVGIQGSETKKGEFIWTRALGCSKPSRYICQGAKKVPVVLPSVVTKLVENAERAEYN